MQTRHKKKLSLKPTPSKYIKRVHDRLSLKIGDLALYRHDCREDSIPVQVYVELSGVLNSNIQNMLYKNIPQKNNPIIIAVDGSGFAGITARIQP